MPVLVGISCCWYGETSSLTLARQSACAGKSCNDGDGWAQRALRDELVFWGEELDYKIFPVA